MLASMIFMTFCVTISWYLCRWRDEKAVML